MKIVVVGFGAGGFAAAFAAKKANPKAEIIVVDEKEYDLMHMCGLPYVIEGLIESSGKLRQNIGIERMGMKDFHSNRLISIDTKKNSIIIENVKNKEKQNLQYDSLILALGAVPNFPPIRGLQENIGKTVFPLHTVNDLEKIEARLPKIKKVVVIGGGPIGCECAGAFRLKGKEVTVIEISEHILFKALDKDMTDVVEQHLKELGVEIHLGKKIVEVKPNAVVVEDGEFPADLILSATGIKPLMDAAKAAGIEFGERRIKVNEKMQTNFENIYAIGDIVETKNFITGKLVPGFLATTAYNQGLVAGKNAAGDNVTYKGHLGTFISMIGHYEVASTGLTQTQADASGIENVVGRAHGTVKAPYVSDKEKVTVKVVFDKKTKKLIGCQAVGKEASKRVDVCSVAIQGSLTVDDLLQTELSYCPPVSEVRDVLLIAVELAARRFR